MLPTNVMSFVKKMVTTQPEANSSTATSEDGGRTFSKLRQIGTDLMTATGNVAKLTPAKVTPVENIQYKETAPIIELPKVKAEQEKPVNRAAACRVCIKSIKPEDFTRICYECQRKVCEDCASYSTTADSDDPQTWRCSVCRRKLTPRDQLPIGTDLIESSLEVPMLEGLQRRHSDARLGSQAIGPSGSLGAGLVPPRSPDLRRHSDVSPASLKDLEKFRKVAGERRSEDWEWRSKSRSGSPDRYQGHQQRERDPDQGGGGERQRVNSPQRIIKSSGIIDQDNTGIDIDEEEERRHRSRRSGGTVRRKSRVTRQHSYDDEIKNAGITSSTSSGHASHSDIGLGLPIQLARRASAYDVYSGGGVSDLAAIIAPQHRVSISGQGNRESESERQPTSSSRRPSFRTNKPVIPYEISSTKDDDKIINADGSRAADVDQGILMPDEELRTRRRGSQLPNINAIRAFSNNAAAPVRPGPTNSCSVSRVNVDERELARQGSLADGEGIKIVIHDVDCEMLTRPNSKKKIILRKDVVIEKGHRTRSFGMRIVGGKIGNDNHLYAIIVWMVSGGPADKAGLQQGDKVLEWSGVSLIDRTFEEVAHIIGRSGDVAELIVEHTNDISGDPLDEPGMVPVLEKAPTNLGLGQIESETNKAPSSPTRRKLPKTPEQIAKERQVTGRVQIQVWYEADRKELVVSVLAADDLCTREDTGYGTAPEAFAKLDLISPSGDSTSLKTDVAEPTHNPIWNATLNFAGVAGEQLIDRLIDVTLWDYCPDRESMFLGGCSIDLTSAFEADRAVWYRLEDPRGLRSGKSPHCSPRGSLSIELAQRLLRRTDLRERSYSDDTQSDSGSPEPYHLHPDHAWLSNSRRGSSQSEQLEIEPYELSKDYSHSLPGSRRSSFQSQIAGTDSKRGSMGDAEVSVTHYNRERRRSSFARPMRDQEEILETLRNLKAQGGKELSRTMSLSGEKRRPNRKYLLLRSKCASTLLFLIQPSSSHCHFYLCECYHLNYWYLSITLASHPRTTLWASGKSERRESSVLERERRNYDRNSESEEDEKWSQSMKGANGGDLNLGPGQIVPKGYKVSKAQQNGKVQLAIFLSKGNLEVEVISAKDICQTDMEEPDTYIKMYLRAEERWLHKRKTRVVRHSRNPQYRQTLKYPSCDALGRNLLVMLWEKKQGFESNQGLGGAEIELDALALMRQTIGWYHLFPIHTLGTQNADSP
ncbi:PREDICTED: regulating synaptic membrane exocytosis protein 1 [Ceratosolen solmsi marchali]|uniref:Regulating synaptic membrane exocytosis protein 1 n=1 Tax=Ceratosolen solmsi marchali TaxID=326594 RepID=A0AAJ6YWL9_9HYME|nr:PREDICTED: regulating synaptic membrane exocytosis protein 1 [Ceratosolen solmsi marchali]